MESKYMEFIRYNWENSVEWKNYLENIFPPPPQNRILHYKKKFYKLKVDSNFDINYIPGNGHLNNNDNEDLNQRNNQNNNQRNNHRNNNNNRNNYRNNNNNNNNYNDVFIYIDFLLSFISFLSFYIHFSTSIKLLLVFYFHNLIKNEGQPKFDQQYFNKIINNESLSYLILLILLLIDNSHNSFIIIPILINNLFWIFYDFNSFFPNIFISKILSFKDFILKLGNFIEMNIFSVIFGYFFKKNSFYFIFLYIQYIKFRFYVNQNMRDGILNINNYLNRIKTSQTSPLILKHIIQTTQNLGNLIFNLPSNVAANTNIAICNIF